MQILSLLETLANNAHHRVSLVDCIKTQPENIQEAFLTNDGIKLKSTLGGVARLADRNQVVFIRDVKK